MLDLLLATVIGGLIGGVAPAPQAFDWVTAGADCEAFACAYIDDDLYGDILTVNGAGQLCVAYSVGGQKAAPWHVLLEGLPTPVVGLAATRAQLSGWRVFIATPKSLFTCTYDRGKRREDLKEHVLEAKHWLHQVDRILESSAPDTTFTSARVADHRLWLSTSAGRWLSGSLRSLELWPSDLRPMTPASAFEVSPPPYEPLGSEGTRPSHVFDAYFDRDNELDTIAVFRATVPYPHRVVRVATAPHVPSDDVDGDGLDDDGERNHETDPFDRDTDDDGLLDGWEVNGLPCATRELDSPLDPRHQDVIVFVSRYEELDAEATKKELERSKRIYAQLSNVNPDGERGIRLHYVFGPAVPKAMQANWPEVGERELPQDCRGIMHWMQVTPGGGGQSSETSDKGGSGLHHAAFAHELGHQLGLGHTGDSDAAWCPFYPSIMNYAFNYSYDGDGEKTRFSDGSLRDLVLDEHALHERLPVAFDKVRYLANGPFRFTVQARGERETWIDWNHDGVENEGTVSADVNYGGSTYAGTRRDVGFVSAGPALALIDGAIVLCSVDRDSGVVALRTFLGEERWSEPRAVTKERASDTEPVLVGAGTGGVVLLRNAERWSAIRFDSAVIDAPVALAEIEGHDVSAAWADGRVLLVARAKDSTLRAMRLEISADSTGKHTVALTGATPLEFRSDVPVGLAQDPRTRELVVAGGWPNADGKEHCFHVARFESLPDGTFAKREARTVGGEHGVVHCTTRPVVRFTREGQLVLFHTGWLDANGITTAWRTTQVANRALNDGWLVCLMYDVWTCTKVNVAFETDGTNSVYSYRWDASADRMNMLQVAHNGLGIDAAPMRDFDDAARISKWGIRHSILWMRR